MLLTTDKAGKVSRLNFGCRGVLLPNPTCPDLVTSADELKAFTVELLRYPKT